MDSTMGPIVAQVWTQLSHEDGVIIVVTSLQGPSLTGASFESTSEV
jgi:hypothetical protein